MSTTQNAVLTVAYTSFTAPAGSVVDHISVTCVGATTGAQTPQQVAPGTASVTFSNLAPDTYTFTAQAFPATGAGYGSPVSTTLVVVSTTVTLQIPGTLSATQP